MAIAQRQLSQGSWGTGIAALRARLRGAVIGPHDQEYEQAMGELKAQLAEVEGM